MAHEMNIDWQALCDALCWTAEDERQWREFLFERAVETEARKRGLVDEQE